MGFGRGTALAAVLAAGGVFGTSPRAWSVRDLPPRLDRVVAWHPGTDGIEWGEIQLSGDGEAWRTRVILARIDPSRVTLALETAFAHDGLWTVADADTSAALAVNAGQFRGSLPWGWVVSGGRELLAPQYAPLAGAVVVDPSGAVRIVPPREVAAERRRGGIREALQSYPMLLENGTPPEPLVRAGLGVAVGHRDARLALGTTADGRAVLALTRFDALGPSLGRIPFGFTSAEMATVMRALGCRDAILLDGGISGQLMVREADGAPRSWAGIRSVPLGLVAVSGGGRR
jgi:exopolysaccharide biosynthesis protein